MPLTTLRALFLWGWGVAKLPWFPFYAKDWVADSQVRGLSGDQMAAYVWLLCEQWMEESLPFDVINLTPRLPKGIGESSVAHVLTQFFPPDPDTNRRRNPKLALLREQGVRMYGAKVIGAGKARARKSLKHNKVVDDQADDQADNQSHIKGTFTFTKNVNDKGIVPPPRLPEGSAGPEPIRHILPLVLRRLGSQS